MNKKGRPSRQPSREGKTHIGFYASADLVEAWKNRLETLGISQDRGGEKLLQQALVAPLDEEGKRGFQAQISTEAADRLAAILLLRRETRQAWLERVISTEAAEIAPRMFGDEADKEK